MVTTALQAGFFESAVYNVDESSIDEAHYSETLNAMTEFKQVWESSSGLVRAEVARHFLPSGRQAVDSCVMVQDVELFEFTSREYVERFSEAGNHEDLVELIADLQQAHDFANRGLESSMREGCIRFAIGDGTTSELLELDAAYMRDRDAFTGHESLPFGYVVTNLKALADEAHTSLEALGEAAGWSKDMFAVLLASPEKFMDHHVARMATALGVPAYRVFTG